MGNMLSVISLLLSIGTATYAVIAARKVSHREVTAAVIADFYSSMRSLTEIQLQEWRLAHLFEVADNYKSVVASLRRVAPPAGDVEAVELQLKERAAALTVFGLYEHVVYQFNEATRAGDHLRTVFLNDAACYFTERLLRNPRLMYLWSRNGGNLECEFEAETRAHYRSKIEVSSGAWDEIGPYGQL
jgi:hypothetical protein